MRREELRLGEGPPWYLALCCLTGRLTPRQLSSQQGEGPSWAGPLSHGWLTPPASLSSHQG